MILAGAALLGSGIELHYNTALNVTGFRFASPSTLARRLGADGRRFVKFWVKLAKGFGYIWLGLTGVLIFIGILGVWMEEGFGAVQDTLSPFNVLNYLVTAILLAPGIAALMWADKQEKKSL
ncbi:MAG: hypothetical protein U5J62_06670 [Desulfurivibrio sp.]|nr:hypothetical protein [Desulfurivibrio sp.]